VAASGALAATSPAGDAHEDEGKEGSRYDSSLGLLTRRFVSLLRDSAQGSLDLKDAAAKLDVKKRRIYDITNVLEGIGVIEKSGKNNIQWKGADPAKIAQSRQAVMRLTEDIALLQAEEAKVDAHIATMEAAIRQLMASEEAAEYAYVTHQDIMDLPLFQGKTVIAVRAPTGATLEVPDPDIGMPPNERRYQVFIKAPGPAPVDLVCVSAVEETQEALSAPMPPADTTNTTNTAPATTSGSGGSRRKH